MGANNADLPMPMRSVLEQRATPWQRATLSYGRRCRAEPGQRAHRPALAKHINERHSCDSQPGQSARLTCGRAFGAAGAERQRFELRRFTFSVQDSTAALMRRPTA
jgi:hypothetical protein